MKTLSFLEHFEIFNIKLSYARDLAAISRMTKPPRLTLPSPFTPAKSVH